MHPDFSLSLQRRSIFNNEHLIHYEVTTDAAQPVPPSPVMDRDPSVTIDSESSTVLLSQDIADKDT